MKFQQGKNTRHLIHVNAPQDGDIWAVGAYAIAKGALNDLIIPIPDGGNSIEFSLGKKWIGEQMQMTPDFLEPCLELFNDLDHLVVSSFQGFSLMVLSGP